MSQSYRVATVITLVLASHGVSAFQLNFPNLDSTTGATSITWDPQTSTCSTLTIQHQCLPDKYVAMRTPVSDKSKIMPIPVDWLGRLIKNGTSHCQAVAQCEDNYPTVSTLASINVYLGSDSKGQPTFSADPGSSSSSSSSSTTNTASTSAGTTASTPATTNTTSRSATNTVSNPSSATNAPTNPAQTAAAPQTNHAPLGPILGGTLGGLAAALFAVAFLLFCRRRQTRKLDSEKDLVIDIDEPDPVPPPTPFILSSSSSPSDDPLASPRSTRDGHRIDAENVSPKARLRAGLGYTMPSSSEPWEGSSPGAPSSSGGTGSADEHETRQQIMHLSRRVMELEASRGDGQLAIAPPSYSVGA